MSWLTFLLCIIQNYPRSEQVRLFLPPSLRTSNPHWFDLEWYSIYTSLSDRDFKGDRNLLGHPTQQPEHHSLGGWCSNSLDMDRMESNEFAMLFNLGMMQWWWGRRSSDPEVEYEKTMDRNTTILAFCWIFFIVGENGRDEFWIVIGKHFNEDTWNIQLL